MLMKIWSNRDSHSLLVGMQNGTATLEGSLAVSQIIKHTRIIWPSNCASWNLPKGLKTYVYAKTCTQMFIAALFTTAKTWKQPRYPSAGEWITKLWYNQTMEYYSAPKINELPSREKIRKNLECIVLSERSQCEKATYCMIPTIWHPGKGETVEKRKWKDQGLPGVGEREGWIEGGQGIFRAVKILCTIL